MNQNVSHFSGVQDSIVKISRKDVCLRLYSLAKIRFADFCTPRWFWPWNSLSIRSSTLVDLPFCSSGSGHTSARLELWRVPLSNFSRLSKCLMFADQDSKLKVWLQLVAKGDRRRPKRLKKRKTCPSPTHPAERHVSHLTFHVCQCGFSISS